MKNNTIILLIAGALLAISSCSKSSNSANNTTTVTPPPTPTVFSDIIFQKSNGTIDSFHISLQSVSGAFQTAQSDSFTITTTNGSGTVGSKEIVSYIISGSPTNVAFKGTNTIRVNWFENTSNQQYVASVYNIESDTTNHILGSFNFGISPAYAGEIQKVDTIITNAPGDTIMCVFQTGTFIGTQPTDIISLWVLECTERIGPSQFNSYADYFLLNEDVNLTKATFYKNNVFASSYSYIYAVDASNRVTQKTMTDNLGKTNIIYYKYK